MNCRILQFDEQEQNRRAYLLERAHEDLEALAPQALADVVVHIRMRRAEEQVTERRREPRGGTDDF